MGLAASQARILLLSSLNNKYELQAQMIESERLMLSQEQEQIATEYSEKTSNQIYVTTSQDSDGDNKQQAVTAKGLVESYFQSGQAGSIVFGDGSGKAFFGVHIDTKGNFDYYTSNDNGLTWDDLEDTDSKVTKMNKGGPNSFLELGLRNGTISIIVPGEGDDANTENESSTLRDITDPFTNQDALWVRKSPDSLSTITSRYYTEDDAAAQAKYQAAMARVNALDSKLETKLNKLETNKKSVETELESAKNLTKTNIERTFKYFS